MTSRKKLDLTSIVDISENALRERYPDALEVLLRDHTTQKNIFWATDNYQNLGTGYSYKDPITPALITGEHNKVIMPRVKKDKMLQTSRIRNMAEVFTPSWVCNAQNNLVDAAWFGRENVFNTEISGPENQHSWQVTQGRIEFPDGKTWKDYVRSNRLEITCGEAPYITSRYDTTTGIFIPVEERIGILDRKLRVVSENTKTSGEWLEWAQEAYKSTYAYEWQGDSLLLAREAMLYTFIENYDKMFQRTPQGKSISYIAYIISWNVWQMDGLKFVIPDSCHEEQPDDFFGGAAPKPCYGCTHHNYFEHNGIYCIIKDWAANEKIRFVDLLDQKKVKDK